MSEMMDKLIQQKDEKNSKSCVYNALTNCNANRINIETKFPSNK
jgi:hypothetical protein